MRHNVNDFHYFLMLNRILTSSIPYTYTYIQFSTFYNSHCHCTCTMTLHLWLANQHFNLCHPKFLIHIYLCFYKMEQHFQFKAQNYLILLFWCRGPLQTQIPPDFQRVDDQEFAFSYNTYELVRRRLFEVFSINFQFCFKPVSWNILSWGLKKI